MKTAVFIAALVAGVTAAPQAVTANVAPKEQTPAGCSKNYNGVFQITPQAIGNKKRGVQKRQSTPLEVTLKDGVLLDAQKRTGYIASNNQFQFDGPAQAGAIYTAGWSVCQNGSLALGNSAVFYQCLSGSFYNLYDAKTAAQCSPVYLVALGSTSPTGTGAAAKNAASVTAGAHTIICQIGDGQIQHDTCVTTATPVAEATDGQITAPKVTGPAITQIGDGQIQAPGPSGASSAPKPTAPAAGTPAVQAPRVSQISDGQIQVPTNGTAIISRTPTVSQPATTAAATPKTSFTGAAVAPTLRAELYGLVAGVVALAML